MEKKGEMPNQQFYMSIYGHLKIDCNEVEGRNVKSAVFHVHIWSFNNLLQFSNSSNYFRVNCNSAIF